MFLPWPSVFPMSSGLADVAVMVSLRCYCYCCGRLSANRKRVSCWFGWCVVLLPCSLLLNAECCGAVGFCCFESSFFGKQRKQIIKRLEPHSRLGDELTPSPRNVSSKRDRGSKGANRVYWVAFSKVFAKIRNT